MPFSKRTVMDQRLEIVLLGSSKGTNISQLCKKYGISRKVYYKWFKRYLEQGESGLADQNKRPKVSPCQIDRSVEERIVELRQINPEWGARKLRVLLERERVAPLPSASTIGAILQRNGLIRPEVALQHRPLKRFEYQRPNELWQMDFKGHFQLLDNATCYPLTITDDHSRFNLNLAACPNQRSLTVKENLIRIFRKYGMPDMILTDNGSPWGIAGNAAVDGEITLSALEIWLLTLSIKVIHGRAYHPQTQGKEERFHRTLKTELLQYEQFRNISHCQSRFDRWRDKYNLERPHQAIGYKTPAQLYKHSLKTFPEKLPVIEYLPNDMLRKVDQRACIGFKGRHFKIGRGLIGQKVAIRPTETENLFEVYFCNRKLKNICTLK